MLMSRKRDVCFKNKCEDPIEIKVLKEEEGWDMFTKNVGSSTINSLNDESLAKNVCKECACLPLVIAAVGKPHDSWKDALDQLQDSKLENIDGIDPKVYIGLELSFNHLQKDAKSCLFLCSVFPEDAAISIEELARLVKGNRLIEDLDTLEKAWDRVRSMVVALKNSSLLLPYDDDDGTIVKLHDIIRDVAKSVTAINPEYAFLKKSGTEWPDVDYKDWKLTSLSFEGINYFPPEDNLACPELHTLVLNLGTYQEGEQFPDWFFSGFPKLRVLVVNARSNSNSPPSLQSLTNLRMLSLHNADLNMSLIKELKNLEMLIILDDDIKELSLELRELKSLRLLDMSRNDCYNMIMPRHLLSSLSNLEELYIPRGFSPRRCPQEEEEDPNLIHHELGKLTNLTTLHILLADVMFFPNEKICKKLLRYVIDITPLDEELVQSRYAKRELRLAKVAMQGGRSSSLEMLLESVEYMELERVNGFQTYFNHGVGEGEAFANLAKLSISECDDLEHLGISRLPQNYPPPTRMRSFSKLTKLRIQDSGFKYLFCPSSARRLVQLRTLWIDNCPLMEEIIRPREQEEEEIIEFPNLEYMHLERLSSLKSFFYCKKIINMWSDQNTSTFPVHSLFNGMVSFPVLKELKVFGVKNVIEIWEPKCRTGNSFSQLKMLDVSLCNKLENVIPLAMLQRSQNMETLNVQDCSSLKCIVNGAKTRTEDQEVSDSKIVFPVPKTLTFTNVPKLDNFWCTRSMGTNTNQHQPSLLQKLSIRNCPLMEEIIRPREQEEEEIIQFPNLKDMYLVDLPRLGSFFYCKKIINMWSDQNTSTFPVHSLFNAMVSFLVLEELRIWNVGNVIEIWEPQCHTESSFSQLKILDVSLCHKLENVTPFAMLRRLQNMETVRVYDCSSLKCIVNVAKTTEDQEGSVSEIVFPVLKTLELAYIDNLWCTRSVGYNTDQHQPSILQKVSFPRLEELIVRGILSEASDLVELMVVNANLPREHGIHHLLCFRGLRMLTVEECKLSTIFTCSFAKTNLQQLEYLHVGWCEKMVEIVRDKNEGNMNLMADAADEILSCEFPRLKRIAMENLPVLKSFCGSARYTFNMPSLEEVVLRNCPLIINFTCRQLTTPPKFTIFDDDYGWKECTDLNKYLQTLLVDRSEGGDM